MQAEHGYGLRTSLLESPFELEITASLLSRIFNRLTLARAEEFAEPLNTTLQRYEINSVCRIACFLGQVGVESGSFSKMEENLRYTTEARLPAVFGSALFRGKIITDYLNNPESLANLVYASILGNGNFASGDGWKYRGRGLIQLTGKANYAGFESRSGVSAVANPDLLLKPAVAVESACDFWRSRALNTLADAGNLEGLTHKVNKAKHKLDERIRVTELARNCLRNAIAGMPFQ
jgi:putative chitinase